MPSAKGEKVPDAAEAEKERELEDVVRASAQLSTDLVSPVRADISALDPATRERIELLLGEIEGVTGDMLAPQNHIPRMEAETLYIERARAEQEARGTGPRARRARLRRMVICPIQGV